MPAAVILVLSAFVFYTTAVFSEKISQELSRAIIAIFALGFLFDLAGTAAMLMLPGRIIANIHAFFGCLALLIMTVHFIWAIRALKKRSRAAGLFRKYSVYAWTIWLFAFCTGIPKY
ncbi:MAG: HsmA family protein [Candidatus Falkowbacteria bacterium]